MENLEKILRWVFPVLLAVMLLFLLGMAGSDGAEKARTYTREDAELLARTVWGEARGCDTTQQAAVVWCILNRVDSRRWGNTIRDVVTQPGQFCGYGENYPVEPEILALVYDVLARWSIEPECVGSVGRVLPEDYYFFSGWGGRNWFRKEFSDAACWDWSLPSPYGE